MKWIIAIVIIIVGIIIFHIVHYRLFCKYRGVAGKSHCAKCGHRKVCEKSLYLKIMKFK